MVHRGYIGAMENNMGTTIVHCGYIGIMEYWGYIGIMGDEMETTILCWEFSVSGFRLKISSSGFRVQATGCRKIPNFPGLLYGCARTRNCKILQKDFLNSYGHIGELIFYEDNLGPHVGDWFLEPPEEIPARQGNP